MNIADAVPVLVALSILIGGAWSVMSFVRNHVDSLRTEMRDEMVQIRGEIARLIEIRNTLLETIRQTVETRTAEIARQLAGLGEIGRAHV